MSPSGLVITRFVKLAPGPVVSISTRFAPTRSAVVLVVVMAPLSLELLLPLAAAAASSALTGSMPRYSAIRISGWNVPRSKVTVTAFALAAAAPMFFA